MARPRNSEVVAETSEITSFDKFVCHVRREQIVYMGKTRGKTISVQIYNLERANVSIPQQTADLLNYNQDHQNNCEGGFPVILQYFPAGAVKVGEVYEAEDLMHPYDNTKIVGLKIHLDKKIS